MYGWCRERVRTQNVLQGTQKILIFSIEMYHNTYPTLKLNDSWLYFGKVYLGFYFYQKLDFLSRLSILDTSCQMFNQMADLGIQWFLDFPNLI